VDEFCVGRRSPYHKMGIDWQCTGGNSQVCTYDTLVRPFFQGCSAQRLVAHHVCLGT